jgi:translocation and assembly module TamB
MADPSPARPRRRGRRLLVRLGVVGLLLVVAAWIAPTVVAKTGLRQVVLSHIFTDLNGTVTAGSASFGWLSPVELRDVTVTDPTGRTALRAERITSSRTLLALALDQSDHGTFTIERAVLDVVCEPGVTNIEQTIANYLIDDGTPPRPQRTGMAVKAEQGRIILREPGSERERTLEPVDLAVTVPRSRAEPITLSISAGSPDPTPAGTASTVWEFSDDITLTVTAERFAAESLAPLIRRFEPGTDIAGRVSGRMAVRWGSDAQGATRARVEGRAVAAGLELAGPWLGVDRLKLQHVDMPCMLILEAGELRIEVADMTSDLGSASVAGTVDLDEPLDRLLARPGLKVDADVDVAKLAAVLPRLLRVRDGTELRDGRVSLHLASRAGSDGTTWDGKVYTTALHGVRNGQPIVWDAPLSAEFAGRMRADGLPVFDTLICRSDFAAVNARGSAEQFVAAANVDLDRLSSRLADFVDLGGLKLTGGAAVAVRSTMRPDGGFSLDSSARLTRFTVADSAGRGLSEPELLAEVRVSGRRDPSGPVWLDSADAILSAGEDRLTASLVEPVADARSARSGKLSARFAGDLARWRDRIGWLGVPQDWQVAGTGTVSGMVAFTADGVASERVTAKLANMRFRGNGLNIDERTLKAEAGTAWERRSGTIALANVRLSCETLGLSATRIDLKPVSSGGYALVGTAAVTTDINRLQRTLGLNAKPDATLSGMAKGIVALDTRVPLKFDTGLTIDRFALGPLARPTWTEPQLKVAAAGEYDEVTELIRFRTLKFERDGMVVDGYGTVSSVATTRDLELKGTLTYDLGMLEPQLKVYLGRDSQVIGMGSRPFSLSGRLAEGNIAALSGSAAVAWQSVRAYGFEVGPAELRGHLDRGTVTTTPVEAAFGGGKVRLEPSLKLTTPGYDLSFTRGRVVDKARLTPAVCADALGYALPAFANATRAEGLVSLDLSENVIPLADPDRAAVRGTLTVHSATVSPGPLITEIATLLGAKQTTLTLTSEQVVPVRLEDGRVYHENFAVHLGQSEIRTSGSVGLDGSLALVLDLPVPPRALERMLPNNPVVRDVLAKQRVKVPVSGTLQRPRLDPKVLDARVQDVVRSAAKSAADELLKKGQERLLEELRKKLDPPKKSD